MLRLRLQRKGRRKRPIWHVVVAESSSPRDGRIIELVGRFDNVTEKKEVYLDEERIFHWLDKGAQPSDSVRKILRREGLLYKRHLMGWGKSQEEIDAALAEWNAYRQSKTEADASRKDKYKSILAAEDKEFKKQVQEKSKQAAAELETEKAAEETAAEAETETTEAAETTAEQGDTSATTEKEATAENEAAKTVETQTEEETVQAKDAEEVPAEDAAAESEAEPVAAETETAEAPETETEVQAEETQEEPAAEKAESNESGKVSTDMTAKEAIDYINDNSLADLEGFVSSAEERVTVQRAWEAKQQEG